MRHGLRQVVKLPVSAPADEDVIVARVMARLLALLVALSGLCWAPLVLGQTEADKTTARNLFFEGKEAYDAKKFDVAADRFRRSDELYPAPTAKLGLARALREGGKLVEAYETYAHIVKEGAADDAPEAFRKAVDSAKSERGELEPRLAAVVIEVTCDCQANVTVDGVDVPRAALGVKRFVNPGSRRIAATAAGWSEAERTVVVEEGQVENVHLELKKTAAPPPPSVPVGPTPTPVPPPQSPETDDGSGLRVAGLVLGGFGLASLVVAGVTGALYLTSKSEVEEKCPDSLCPSQEEVDTAETGQTMGLVNTITLPVGAAALGTGVLLYLIAPDGDDEEVTTLPWIGPATGGVVLQGSF
jgi:hypothetical protein